MFRPARTPPSFFTLAFMASVSVLSFNSIAPSLAGISSELGASYALTSLAVSGFLAVNAVLYVVLGPLSDRYGRRPVLLWSAALFTLASVGAALAQDITTFLTFRTLQAAIAAGSVVSGAAVRDMSGPEDAASRLGYLGMTMAVAPMVGPMIGGALDQIWGWRSIFWMYAACGGALWWLCWADAGETHHVRSARFTDQMRGYPELLGTPAFWAYILVMACGIGAFFVFIAGAPLVSAQIFGLEPVLLGIGIGTITLGFFSGSFVSGRIAARVGLARMVLLGRSFTLVGVALVLALWLIDLFHPILFFAAAVATGIGNGLTTPSARAGSMSVRADLAGSASGLGNALVVAVGAALTQLTGQVLTPENGVWMMLTIMLALAIAGFLLALWIRTLPSPSR